MANPEQIQTDPGEIDRRDSSAANKFRRSIFNVPVTVTVSIGQKRMSVSEILELGPDSVVALSSRIEDPVSLSVDNKLIARGELIEIEEGGLGVKITEIVEEGEEGNE
ncbi:FliM/FliN family flagellar motor switch protein [Henriciella mobilis]|uniref:Flagellar motor switch protein FliN n=1 Tax=Henriciella mobilis TaxID=2305467 RepID=A0A399R8U6_9PROT|nr:FliM/FliN family flagellar motor switch protein [Henriciella mobilis]RIJ18348.1 flagellar motor switch protein FliN [Henriciella mobilis]RIJ24849.1 flagellar motor switch protein FliN [Henriciella mobilis]RIJ26901.1 flagellar motor switch protein FliN [Henriciella mobilis]